MKHWQESQRVFEWLSTLHAEQRRAALATVVSVRGSAYRREGAKLAVAEDGASVGNVSGGCLEMDVRELALEVIASGLPQLRSYCSSTDEIRAWDLGVGCEGEVKIFVEPAYAGTEIEQMLLAAAVPFAVCTIVDTTPAAGPRRRRIVTATGHEGEAEGRDFDPDVVDEARRMLGAGRSSVLHEFADHAVFIDIYRPPPQLVIVGAGNDARPLARAGAEVGFRTSVVDRRPGLLHPGRFPGAAKLIDSTPGELTRHVTFDAGTYVVVMTHNFADDEQYLRALVSTPAPYIGILGPRQRTERLVASVAADTPFDSQRIYGPVGLDIGTDGAEQVALAIVAELLAVRGGRNPRSLRDRDLPIHVPVAGWGLATGG